MNAREDVECAICSDAYVEPRQLACGHVYCVECLERWVANDAGLLPRLTCPTCREPFQLPDDGGVRDLPAPVPDSDDVVDDVDDDVDLASFEILVPDVLLDIDLGTQVFSNHVINFWNKLPDCVVQAPSTASFKKRLFSFVNSSGAF